MVGMNNKTENKKTETVQNNIRARNAVNAIIFAAQYGEYDPSRDGLARRNLGPEQKMEIPEWYLNKYGTAME